jgi:putative redox protein
VKNDGEESGKTMEVNVKLRDDVQFEIAARKHTLLSDQPEENGGHDEGMTPPELFLAALGSCAAFYTSAYLKKKGLSRAGVEVRVKADKAGPPARLDNFRIEVDVPLTLSEADRAGVDQAVHHCLIHNTLLHPPTIQIELRAPAAV